MKSAKYNAGTYMDVLGQFSASNIKRETWCVRYGTLFALCVLHFSQSIRFLVRIYNYY